MLYAHVANSIVCLAIGGAIAWNVQGWRLGDEIADLRASYADAARSAEASARAKEQAAATTVAQIEKEARNAQKTLSDQLAAARRELRNRPERPSGGDVSKSPASGVGCTGAQLYAPDAEFLVGHAARAESVRLQLEACKARYDQAVKLTN